MARRACDRLRLVLDADLGHCAAVASEARLIGRTSHARGVAAWVRDGADPAILPEDTPVGDLIAIPCRHATRLHDVRIAFDDHGNEGRPITPRR